jgi:exonuclease SbcD
MKFFHLSDLHIGKQLHHYSLKEDQEKILQEVAEYARKLHPDAIVIAGDVYDKSVPSAEAVTILDAFLTMLSEIEPAIPILIISGNHDSAERLQFASEILKKHHIYLAGEAPRTSEEFLQKVTLQDAYGEVDFYLLPFVKPSYVKHVCEERKIESYTDAIQMLLEREEIDYNNKRNVLVSHQFYMGSSSPETCDSESISVGGLDQVDANVVGAFDYVALGHLHGAQNLKVETTAIRYCGTLLKYSVSECNHQKTLTVVTLEEKGKAPEIELLPLHPIRDVKKKTGTLEEILEGATEAEKDDYVSVTLTDEVEPYKPKEQLERMYRHVLEVRVDNARTKKKLLEIDEEVTFKDPLTNFADFYREIQGREMSEKEAEIIQNVLASASDED